MFLGRRKTRCRKVRGMLSEYIDNRLDSEGRGVVEHHLEMCEACSNEFESLQMTVQLLHQVPEMPTPRSFAIREADVVRESVPKPRRWGELRPVPVVATNEVETARPSIFDPQRLRWLRPATAFATVALIALLIVDFLQVVPHDVGNGGGEVFMEPPAQIMLSPTPEGRGDEPVVPLPTPVPTIAPAPIPGEEAPAEDVSSDELGLGIGQFGEKEAIGESEAVWPLRQIEIGIGALVFVLVALMFIARWQRRRWSRA